MKDEIATTLGSPIDRQLDYYKRECNALGGRLVRQQHELTNAIRDARRNRVLLELTRELYRLRDIGTDDSTLALRTLQSLVDITPCTSAALMRETRKAPGHLVVHEAVGIGNTTQASPIMHRGWPDFVFTTRENERSQISKELVAVAGVPFVLWHFDPRSGYGLLLGNRFDTNANQAWDEGDRDFAEIALSAYLDGLYHNRFIAARQDGVSSDGLSDLPLCGGKRQGLDEADLKRGFQEGGRVDRLLAVERSDGPETEYVAYVSVSWARGYHLFKTKRRQRERTYRDLTLLVHFARDECGVFSAIPVYVQGDPVLRSLPGILEVDHHAPTHWTRDRQTLLPQANPSQRLQETR